MRHIVPGGRENRSVAAYRPVRARRTGARRARTRPAGSRPAGCRPSGIGRSPLRVTRPRAYRAITLSVDMCAPAHARKPSATCDQRSGGRSGFVRPAADPVTRGVQAALRAVDICRGTATGVAAADAGPGAQRVDQQCLHGVRLGQSPLDLLGRDRPADRAVGHPAGRGRDPRAAAVADHVQAIVQFGAQRPARAVPGTSIARPGSPRPVRARRPVPGRARRRAAGRCRARAGRGPRAPRSRRTFRRWRAARVCGRRRHQRATWPASVLASSSQDSIAGWQPMIGQPGRSQVKRCPVRQAPGVTAQPCAAYRRAARRRRGRSVDRGRPVGRTVAGCSTAWFETPDLRSVAAISAPGAVSKRNTRRWSGQIHFLQVA